MDREVIDPSIVGSYCMDREVTIRILEKRISLEKYII